MSTSILSLHRVQSPQTPNQRKLRSQSVRSLREPSTINSDIQSIQTTSTVGHPHRVKHPHIVWRSSPVVAFVSPIVRICAARFLRCIPTIVCTPLTQHADTSPRCDRAYPSRASTIPDLHCERCAVHANVIACTRTRTHVLLVREMCVAHETPKRLAYMRTHHNVYVLHSMYAFTQILRVCVCRVFWVRGACSCTLQSNHPPGAVCRARHGGAYCTICLCMHTLAYVWETYVHVLMLI